MADVPFNRKDPVPEGTPPKPHRKIRWSGGRRKGQKSTCSACGKQGHDIRAHVTGRHPTGESVAMAMRIDPDRDGPEAPLPEQGPPLARAKARLYAQEGKNPFGTVSKSARAESDPMNREPSEFAKLGIAAMLAAGIAPSRIGHAFAMTADRARKVLASIDVKQHVADFREAMKVVTMARVIGIQEAALTWAEETIRDKQAKEFDHVTRGIDRMEKVAASAAGELMPPKIQIANIHQTLAAGAEEEALALVRALKGEPSGSDDQQRS